MANLTVTIILSDADQALCAAIEVAPEVVALEAVRARLEQIAREQHEVLVRDASVELQKNPTLRTAVSAAIAQRKLTEPAPDPRG